MDVFAHTLWTNAVARKANNIAQKKRSKFRVHVGWAAFWGVFPDFFAFTVPFLIVIYKVIFSGLSFSYVREHHGLVSGFDIAGYLYQFSHSVVIWALVFVLIWILSKRPRYELLGWLLHILIDIPSHAPSFYPTPFLFPVSTYVFPYGVSWGNKWYMIINYGLLLVVWSKTLLQNKNKKPPTGSEQA